MCQTTVVVLVKLEERDFAKNMAISSERIKSSGYFLSQCCGILITRRKDSYSRNALNVPLHNRETRHPRS